MNQKSIVSVSVGPVTYKVKRQAKVVDDQGDDCEALVDHEKCVILIEKSAQPDRFQVLLDHERAHCVMVQSGCRQALSPYFRPDVDLLDDVEETILVTFLNIFLEALRRVDPSHPKFIRTIHIGTLRYKIKRVVRVKHDGELVESRTDHRTQEIFIDRTFATDAYQASLAYEIGMCAMHHSGCSHVLSKYLKKGVQVDDMAATFLQIFVPAYIDSLRRDTYKET